VCPTGAFVCASRSRGFFLAAQFLTAQVIRIVTEKVMENVSRQLRQQQSDAPALLNAPPDMMSVLTGMHQQLMQTQAMLAAVATRLSEVEEHVTELDGRTASIESRWGWKLWAAIVGSLALTFALGFIAASLLKVFG
jgi:hypothetical protein